MKRLNVFINRHLVGELTQDRGGQLGFVYSENWLSLMPTKPRPPQPKSSRRPQAAARHTAPSGQCIVDSMQSAVGEAASLPLYGGSRSTATAESSAACRAEVSSSQ